MKQKSFAERFHDQMKEKNFKGLMDKLYGRHVDNGRLYAKDADHWELAFELMDEDEATTKLFLDYDLNKNDPFVWRALLEALCAAHLPPDGRPPKWTFERCKQLYHDAQEIELTLPKRQRTGIGICRELLKRPPYSERYLDIKAHALSKILSALKSKSLDLSDDNYAEMSEEAFWKTMLRDGVEDPALTSDRKNRG
jgi:hypothetical protein